MAVLAFAVAFEQFLDQPAGLQPVQGFDRQPEHLLGQGFDRFLVDLVLLDQGEDERLLFVRTDPGVTGIVGGLS